MFDSPLVPVSLSILPIQLRDVFCLSSQHTAWKEKTLCRKTKCQMGLENKFRWVNLIWNYVMVHLVCFWLKKKKKKKKYNFLTSITNSPNSLPIAKVHNYTKQDDVLNWFGVCIEQLVSLLISMHALSALKNRSTSTIQVTNWLICCYLLPTVVKKKKKKKNVFNVIKTPQAQTFILCWSSFCVNFWGCYETQTWAICLYYCDFHQ